MPDAVVLSRVTKSFGAKRAVDGIDLTVASGTIAGFIGPNGAGKTTSIRMMLSILEPDSGEVRVLGEPAAHLAKDRVGYLPEERGVYRRMKVGGFIEYMARLKGVRSSGLAANVRTALGQVGLGDCYGKRCEELSKGMQQKVQFLAATIHDPELLVLDEPFSGLDPVNARLLTELILERRRRGKTVVFSTHVMHQAETLCDHVFMIHHGKKVLDRSVPEILADVDGRTIAVELRGGGVLELALPSIESVARVARGYLVTLREGADPSEAIRAIAAAAPVRRVELVRPTLEDVFVRLAGVPPEEEGPIA